MCRKHYDITEYYETDAQPKKQNCKEKLISLVENIKKFYK